MWLAKHSLCYGFKINLLLDELAEDLGNRPAAGDDAELPPRLVVDLHARHPVADGRRGSSALLGAASLSAALPHVRLPRAYTA